jgi:hypothetical protein
MILLLILPSSGITGMHYHTWLPNSYFLNLENNLIELIALKEKRLLQLLMALKKAIKMTVPDE